MADDVRLTCWPTPDRLAIGIQVGSLSGQLHNESEELVQLDTGYSEEILIPHGLFEALNLGHWRLPQVPGPTGTTVTGQVIQFLEAHADVVIPRTGERHRVIVQTFVGNTRFLIGRAFLRRFKVLLDGPGGQTCLLTPAT
ncbi:MAG: hypothetical protein HY260_12015 [Chloroflexi bacterium]|nr:hypothetical protein [Chloroflexota bacterium]